MALSYLLALAAPSAFLAPPYVQLGRDDGTRPLKSLTVAWHTTRGTRGWSVKYRSESRPMAAARIGFLDVEVGVVPNHSVMSARLIDLKAGEAVKYEISLDGKAIFSGATRAPKNANQPWTMAMTGDTGRGTPGQKRIMYELHRTHPDSVLVAGDIVYPKGRMSEYQKYFWPMSNADTLDPKVGAPSMRSTLWVGVTGNHDTAYRDLRANPDGLAYYAYWIQPLNGPDWSPAVKGPDAKAKKAAGAAWGRGGNFWYRYGNAAIIALDSNTYANWKVGKLRDWLAQTLAANKDATWKIVVFHQPGFHSSIKKSDERYMAELNPLFASAGVNLVLNGHVHNYQRTRPILSNGSLDRDWNGKTATKAKGPVYVVSGAGGAELYDQQLADQPSKWKPFTIAYKKGYSFSFLTVKGGHLEFKQISDQGKEIDRFVLTK